MLNAFEILANYRRQARKAGVPAETIAAVIVTATSGDYDHLCATIFENLPA